MDNGEMASASRDNHFHRYLTYAISLLDNYRGQEPFHLYLKKYFSINKRHGSKDRKIITSLCYSYFRLGQGVPSTLPIEEKMLLATFLTGEKSSVLLQTLEPRLNQGIHQDIWEKIAAVNHVFNPEEVFPFNEQLSRKIDVKKFNLSFLIQPKLFVRIRPKKETVVVRKLKEANISYEKLPGPTLAFSNNEKISSILSIDREVVIQDYNSQRTEDLLKTHFQRTDSGISVWDCCAASGGKSILAYDLFENIDLTVSDTRKSILQNLLIRFKKAGVKNYSSFIADLSVSSSIRHLKEPVDVIIADVPCSGSGTWARTPEQLSFFEKSKIDNYAELQRKIVVNAVPYLKEKGVLLYITCSVFKKENEENVTFIQDVGGLTLLQSKYLNGYEMRADTMFVALFAKQ